MTLVSSEFFNPDELEAQLDSCYDRLVELMTDKENNDLKEMSSVADEATQLVNHLIQLSEKDGRTTMPRNKLLSLQSKLNALIDTMRQEMLLTKQQLMKLRQGKNAVKGYRPIRYGMGYTSGKFVDSKK